MNKSSLKTFAIESRVELQSKIITQLTLLQITEKEIIAPTILGASVEIRGEKYPKKSYDALVHKYKYLGYKELVEEVAYTWFNRLVAIGFMEANGYIDEKMVFSAGGKATPDILDNYYEQEFFKNLSDSKKDKINLLKDENKDEELYSILVEERCKELSKIMPFMFEGEGDYVELLFPKGILMENSFISKLRKNLEESKEEGIIPVEYIGWLYQYYNQDRRDLIFDSNMSDRKKIEKYDIPAATQIFTPKWITKHIVDNTLGKILVEKDGLEQIKNNLEFFIPSKADNVKLEDIPEIENIKIFDPSMGSGHILVYSFEVIYKAYELKGWTPKEAVLSILKNNLFGLEIDDRAAQLASFALIMTARSKYNRLFKSLENEAIKLNTLSIQESNEIDLYLLDLIKDNNLNELYYLIDTYKDAKEYGSLIKIRELNLEKIEEQLQKLNSLDMVTFPQFKDIFDNLIYQARIMAQKYDVTVTNPPYMGNARLNEKLKKFVQVEFPETKSDLFAMFMWQSTKWTKPNGLIGLVTPYVWMFIKSYEELRDKLVRETTFNTLIQLEYNAFEGACIPVGTFTLINRPVEGYKGDYIKLSDFRGIENQPIKTREAIENPNVDFRYSTSQQDFHKIPGSPIAYWVSDRVKEIFEKSEKMFQIGSPKEGMKTGNNELFIRNWSEIEIKKMNSNFTTREETINFSKWVPYNKGGEFRRWYGNLEYVVNFENNAEKLTKYEKSSLSNSQYYFNEGITWTLLSSSSFGVRYQPKGTVPDMNGKMMYDLDLNLNYILGLMTTKIYFSFLQIINPTMAFQAGNIGVSPVIVSKDSYIRSKIETIVNILRNLSKSEWDSRETSWDFGRFALVDSSKLTVDNSQLSTSNIQLISDAFELYSKFWSEKFFEMHRNEEELNRLFIEIYGLEDEMTPDVDLKDITLLKKELLRRKSAKKATEEEEAEEAGLILDSEGKLQFNKEEIIKQFISYAVGCIMGRYSLDKEGLVIANSDDKLIINSEELIVKGEDGEIRHSIPNPTFIPDAYGIIPVVSEDGIFTNDLLTRFIEFVGTVYGKDTLKENLDFIACALEGKDSVDSPKETIKKYLLKDFITDHIQRYSKRPIYWMFNSGKENGFNCLVYMHRYNPMTIAQIRTDYLLHYQGILENMRNNIENELEQNETENFLSASDKKEKSKKLKDLSSSLNEISKYAILIKDYADRKVSIDLDDGVAVNYAKFKDLLVKIK